MLDPIVHAALVTVFVYLIDLLFKAIGVSFGNEVLQALAEVIVGYILSLFGLGLYLKATVKGVLAENRWYRPPFVG